jgi:hypothetical protein
MVLPLVVAYQALSGVVLPHLAGAESRISGEQDQWSHPPVACCVSPRLPPTPLGLIGELLLLCRRLGNFVTPALESSAAATVRDPHHTRARRRDGD